MLPHQKYGTGKYCGSDLHVACHNGLAVSKNCIHISLCNGLHIFSIVYYVNC
jgi:hypothetical protein